MPLSAGSRGHGSAITTNPSFSDAAEPYSELSNGAEYQTSAAARGAGRNYENTMNNATLQGIDASESSSDAYYSTVADEPEPASNGADSPAVRTDHQLQRRSSVAIDKRIEAETQKRKLFAAYSVAACLLLIALIVGGVALSKINAMSDAINGMSGEKAAADVRVAALEEALQSVNANLKSTTTTTTTTTATTTTTTTTTVTATTTTTTTTFATTCSQWYDPTDYYYPYYYQDDPTRDDLPSNAESYLSGFNTGTSYFGGLDKLATIPTADGQRAEICAIISADCAVNCIDAQRLVPQVSCEAFDARGLTPVQRAIAIMAGACNDRFELRTFFFQPNQFNQDGFYDAPEQLLVRGQKASGKESLRWTCSGGADQASGPARYHADTPNFHTWGGGLDFQPARTDVEIGYFAGANQKPRTSGGSCGDNVGHVDGYFARVGKRVGGGFSPKCLQWYDPTDYYYPYYYQDDPTRDDLPSNAESYLSGFNTGTSYFGGLDKLATIPTADGQRAEICAIISADCAVNCIDAQRLVPQVSCEAFDARGLTPVQRAIAIMAGACNDKFELRTFFFQPNQFNQDGFYDAPEQLLVRGQKASGKESLRWTCQDNNNEPARYHADTPNFHTYGAGLDFQPARTDVEIGYFAGENQKPRTSGGSCGDDVGHVDGYFARVGKRVGRRSRKDLHNGTN